MKMIFIAEEMSVCCRFFFFFLSGRLILANPSERYTWTRCIVGRELVRCIVRTNPLPVKQSLFPADRLRYWARTGLPSGNQIPSSHVQRGQKRCAYLGIYLSCSRTCSPPAYLSYLRFSTCIRVGSVCAQITKWILAARAAFSMICAVAQMDQV